jgi:hypothetical protein
MKMEQLQAFDGGTCGTSDLTDVLGITATKEDWMSAQQDYWQECISIAAEECDLTLTPEQLAYLAEAVEGGHEHYGQAFYSPPASDRLDDIEREWKAKLKAQQDEHERYMRNAETAVKQALRVHCDDQVTIGSYGEVLRHGGRTERIQ